MFGATIFGVLGIVGILGGVASGGVGMGLAGLVCLGVAALCGRKLPITS